MTSLIGLLNFACRVVVPGRAFIEALNQSHCGINRPYYHIRTNKQAKVDLLAWQTFLHRFNGKAGLLQSLFISIQMLLVRWALVLYLVLGGFMACGLNFGYLTT